MATEWHTGWCIAPSYRDDIDTYQVFFPRMIGGAVSVGGDVIRAEGIDHRLGHAEVIALIDDSETQLIFGRSVTQLTFLGAYTVPLGGSVEAFA